MNLVISREPLLSAGFVISLILHSLIFFYFYDLSKRETQQKTEGEKGVVIVPISAPEKKEVEEKKTLIIKKPKERPSILKDFFKPPSIDRHPPIPHSPVIPEEVEVNIPSPNLPELEGVIPKGPSPPGSAISSIDVSIPESAFEGGVGTFGEVGGAKPPQITLDLDGLLEKIGGGGGGGGKPPVPNRRGFIVKFEEVETPKPEEPSPKDEDSKESKVKLPEVPEVAPPKVPKVKVSKGPGGIELHEGLEVSVDHMSIGVEHGESPCKVYIENREIISAPISGCRKWLERAKREPGRIKAHFWVSPDGRVVSIRIERSSGIPELDNLVKEDLKKWKFSRLPQGEPRKNQLGYVIFKFRLE